MPPASSESGLIIRSQSGFYTIQTGSGTLTCSLRGRLKQGRHSGDIAAVGDRVQVRRQTDGSGTIEEVEPRTSSLVRLDPRPQGIYQQVLLANPDQVVFVFACAYPAPHLRMLDRFLVIAEKQCISAFIIANKVDLGVDDLRTSLTGKISALAGPSGVGKSSLLNAVQPGLGLAVSEISEAFRKGRHTTTVRELFPLEMGGFVADTPGLRSLALWDTEPEELDGYFPEIAPLVTGCQFNDCKHRTEPGCAVRAAVNSGLVRAERYDSYLRLRAGEE
jgi:ribosome biogenesis GTPase